ncbi:uncharacterized protein VTP21DRAFT_4341 [Calcarisporiella thermophila]|uniref:uncharacterized protein n=1 Tax=Calcarisporiella thermophila TaxID=911321 RepID=UPI0037426F73
MSDKSKQHIARLPLNLSFSKSWLEYLFKFVSNSETIHEGIYIADARMVFVSDPFSIQELWDHGNFGKGNLSRSKPDYEKRMSRISGDMMDSVENAKECLCLNLVEAFFLTYSLGCLRVYDTMGNIMSIEKCWSEFSHKESHLSLENVPPAAAPNNPFITSYVAYHYYRSRRWVVRSGLSYGVDYVLYRKGPEYDHAPYAVVVIPVESGISHSLYTWHWLATLSRVSGQVNKSVVICYVYIPSIKYSSPLCLDQYRVREVMVKRWIPERNRD